MYNIIKCEFFKLRKSRSFYVIFLVMAAMSLLMFYMIASREQEIVNRGTVVNSGVNIFLNALSDFSLYATLGAIFAGMFICGDFENRTLQNGISAGGGRLTILAGKAIVYFIAVSMLSLPYPLINLICSTIRFGFGLELSIEIILKLLGILTAFLFSNCALVSICVSFAFVIQKVGGVIGAGIAVIIFGGNIIISIAAMRPELAFIFDYSPYGLSFSSISLDNGTADFIKVIFISLIYMAVVLAATYGVFKKAELK